MYDKIIKNALKKLIKNDLELINRKLREECINHKLAQYIEKEFKDYKIKTNVDLEYDKSFEDPKYYVDDSGTRINIRPDIIVHERNSNKTNLIALECKKGYSSKNDRIKLYKLLSKPYKYRKTYSVSYLPSSNYILLKIFQLEGNNQGCFSYKIQKPL